MTDKPATFRFQDSGEMEKVSADLLKIGKNIPVWLFDGHMGAGKTTLIKELCRQLGVTENVHSPTFSLVNEYAGNAGPIYHFDFYRIDTETEALDMGVEEYLDSGAFCFIEWPDKIQSLWPMKYLSLNLQADESGLRTLEVKEI